MTGAFWLDLKPTAQEAADACEESVPVLLRARQTVFPVSVFSAALRLGQEHFSLQWAAVSARHNWSTTENTC